MIPRRIRVLIADDSILFRKMIREALSREPDYEFVGVVRDGMDVLEKIKQFEPDLVTLDLGIPVLSGIDVLREIRRQGLQTNVLVVSAMTEDEVDTSLEALRLGAYGIAVKPTGGNATENCAGLKSVLASKFAAFRLLHVRLTAVSTGENAALEDQGGQVTHQSESNGAGLTAMCGKNPSRFRKQRQGALSVVVIGTSTGGPEALRSVLPAIPWDFPFPVLVVQHMPKGFTASLADSLDGICPVNVAEAAHGDLVEPGRILIAPGGEHMKLRRQGNSVIVELTTDAPEHHCRPSVDVLFRSAVDVYGAGTLGIIMTGMGEDGAEGCRLIKNAGGSVIAQDEESCVVFGMPRLPVEEGIADAVVPLSELTSEMLEFMRAEACV